MSGQDKTDFANLSGDEEMMMLILMGKLKAAQEVLEAHVHKPNRGVSIHEAFDFLVLRIKSLPMVRMNNTTGVLEYRSESEENYERSYQNSAIHTRYRRYAPTTDDAFRDILIPYLMHSYEGYPEVVEALKTIRDSLAHEQTLKSYQREKLSPYEVQLRREEFRQNCFKKQNPPSGTELTREMT